MAAGEAIRRLGPGDRDLLLGHFLRLGPDDRQRRFGGHVSDASVRAYCTRLDLRRSVVLGCFAEGALRGVGELKPIGGSWPRAAELAVSVEGPCRGRGFATELCRRLAVRARNRFVGEIYMLCLADNRQVQRLARRLGGSLTFHPGEVEARLAPPWPDPMTTLEEWLDEAAGLIGGSPLSPIPRSRDGDQPRGAWATTS